MRSAAFIAVVLALAGCGSDSGSKQSASTNRKADCAPLTGAALTPQTSSAQENRATAYLTTVGLDTIECSDRVAFGFEPTKAGPGYQVSYESADRAKVEDGSGKPVKIAGSAFLVVRLTPAMTAHLSGDKVDPTYTGPRRITPEGFSFVRQVVKTGDFEAVVTWVIGLDGKRPFKTTASKSRLLIEIG